MENGKRLCCRIEGVLRFRRSLKEPKRVFEIVSNRWCCRFCLMLESSRWLPSEIFRFAASIPLDSYPPAIFGIQKFASFQIMQAIVPWSFCWCDWLSANRQVKLDFDFKSSKAWEKQFFDSKDYSHRKGMLRYLIKYSLQCPCGEVRSLRRRSKGACGRSIISIHRKLNHSNDLST